MIGRCRTSISSMAKKKEKVETKSREWGVKIKLGKWTRVLAVFL